jgi:hypothetical protein
MCSPHACPIIVPHDRPTSNLAEQRSAGFGHTTRFCREAATYELYCITDDISSDYAEDVVGRHTSILENLPKTAQ